MAGEELAASTEIATPHDTTRKISGKLGATRGQVLRRSACLKFHFGQDARTSLRETQTAKLASWSVRRSSSRRVLGSQQAHDGAHHEGSRVRVVLGVLEGPARDFQGSAARSAQTVQSFRKIRS